MQIISRFYSHDETGFKFSPITKLMFSVLLLSLISCGGGSSGGGSGDDDPAGPTDAQIAAGARIYEDWIDTGNGGSGVLPSGETVAAYVQCVSCHGWDLLGEDGGDKRVERAADQPNTGLGDSNSSSRNISTGSFGTLSEISIDQILAVGGRSWSEGSAVWDGTDANASLGNQHPDYSLTESLTDEQLTNLLAFLNTASVRADQVFSGIHADQNPVAYTLRADASETRGESYYQTYCVVCHAAPDSDSTELSDNLPGEGGLLAFIGEDGAASKLMHRMMWGKAGTTMTRAVVGNPDALDVADVIKYLNSLENRTENASPSANAGSNITVDIGAIVQLDGSNSYDIDGDSLTYLWQFDAFPAGSTAALDVDSSVTPSFVADVAGDYELILTVNDGVNPDVSDTVTITAVDDPVARGQSLWEERLWAGVYHCIDCHGDGAEYIAPIPLANDVVDGFIERGEGNMDFLIDLITEDEMADIRAYLDTL